MISSTSIEQQLLPVTSPRNTSPRGVSPRGFSINFSSSTSLHNYGSDAFQITDNMDDEDDKAERMQSITERLKEAGNRTGFVDAVRSNARLHRSEKPEAKAIDFTDFRTESTALDDVAEMEEDALDDDLQ